MVALILVTTSKLVEGYLYNFIGYARHKPSIRFTTMYDVVFTYQHNTSFSVYPSILFNRQYLCTEQS